MSRAARASFASAPRADVASILAGARRLALATPIWTSVLAFILYLPSALGALQLSPDATEYIDLSRHLAAGDGFQLTIKNRYIGEPAVVRTGLEWRSPLYPLLSGGLLHLGFGFESMQVLNALLAAGCVGTVAAIGTLLFGQRTGGLAGLLAATSPVMLVRMVPPMTEALSIFLTLLATLILVRDLHHPRVSSFAAAGAILGLGYLTRPVALPMAAMLIVGVIAGSSDRRQLVRPLLALGLGLSLFVVPITLYSLSTRGSFTYSGQTSLYALSRSASTRRTVSDEPLPTAGEYVSTNLEYVVSAISENVRDYSQLLFLDPDWLLPLLPAWPLAGLALLRGRYPRLARPVLLLGVGNFAFYALSWALNSERYQLLTLLLLLPFAVNGLARLSLDRLHLPAVPGITALHLAIVLVVLSWSPTFLRTYRGTYTYAGAPVGTRDYRDVTWTGPPQWVKDDELEGVFDWVRSRTAPDSVLAYRNGSVVALFTARPAARLPTKLDSTGLRKYIVDYRIDYVIHDTRDKDRREYEVYLAALEAEGVRVAALRSHRIYDTRSVWRRAEGVGAGPIPAPGGVAEPRVSV